jgi:hypothetical protein
MTGVPEMQLEGFPKMEMVAGHQMFVRKPVVDSYSTLLDLTAEVIGNSMLQAFDFGKNLGMTLNAMPILHKAAVGAAFDAGLWGKPFNRDEVGVALHTSKMREHMKDLLPETADIVMAKKVLDDLNRALDLEESKLYGKLRKTTSKTKKKLLMEKLEQLGRPSSSEKTPQFKKLLAKLMGITNEQKKNTQPKIMKKSKKEKTQRGGKSK